MKNPIALLFACIFLATTAHSQDCGCFNGIGSSPKDSPSVTFTFENGKSISICGYEFEETVENGVKMSEFNAFDCETGDDLLEYDATQSCIVSKTEKGIAITELTYLPAGSHWKWMSVEIAFQEIYAKDDQVVVSPIVPAYTPVHIEEARAEEFMTEVRKMKGTRDLENPEEIIGRLEILALNNHQEAKDILQDFSAYFNYTLDGAISEQWRDAIAIVNWVGDYK